MAWYCSLERWALVGVCEFYCTVCEFRLIGVPNCVYVKSSHLPHTHTHTHTHTQIITVHRETKAGFTTIEALVEGLNEYAGYQLRVLAKNENYVAQQMINGRHGEVLAVTPDLICIIDSDNGQLYIYMMLRVRR